MSREREGTFREAGGSHKGEAEEVAVLTGVGGWGDEDEIDVSLTCLVSWEGSHTLSAKVPVKNQTQKSAATTQSGPLSLLRASHFLSINSITLLILCCLRDSFFDSVRQGPVSPTSCTHLTKCFPNMFEQRNHSLSPRPKP